MQKSTLCRRRSFELRFGFRTGPSRAPGDLRGLGPPARRALGDDHEITLRLRYHYGDALLQGLRDSLLLSLADASREPAFIEAKAEIEDVYLRMKRVLGAMHPLTKLTAELLDKVRAVESFVKRSVG